MPLEVLDPLVHLPSANYPVMDPVCGMAVRPREAPAHSDFAGERYFFCSVNCMSEFRFNPSQYTNDDSFEDEEGAFEAVSRRG